jgi:hypothetical protein
MQKKQNDKIIRLRYIRVLEKFVTKTISLLQKDSFDIDLYKKAILKLYSQLQNTKSTELYNEYPIALKNLVQYILDTLENHSDDFLSEKNTILKKANLLDKLKNKNKYKKQKHKKIVY